ncbi:hypothetical protein B0H19DRAFT_1103080 [Mycena capillaripes]|nr:hypothetical protein B0H19DRAFT_1103080 [Mycena capillaripes]
MDELSSLRAEVTRFQNQAHTPFIKLQRYGLDTSELSEWVAHLEAENTLLKSELAVLRNNPILAEKAEQQDTVAQLTLALRWLNAKLSFTEAALSEQVLALTQATALAAQHAHASTNMHALAVHVRGHEEEALLRERALELEVQKAREETRLSDRVVGEYAALVRTLTLEGRSPPRSASDKTSSPEGDIPSPAAGLLDAKAQLAALIDAFAEKNIRLEARVAELEGQLTVLEAQFGAAETLSAELSNALARAKFSEEQARLDDKSVAAIVERYMKFTQQTTSALHQSLQALRQRYSATLSTLQTQLAVLSMQLHASKAETHKLGDALDRMGGMLLRETAGRRREVEGRVKLVVREEGVIRALQLVVRESDERRECAWRRREGQSAEDKADGEEVGDTPRDRDELEVDLQAFEAGVRGVLEHLDSDDGGHGSEGRVLLLESAVKMLVGELEGQMARKVELKRWVRHIDEAAAFTPASLVEAPDLIDLDTPASGPNDASSALALIHTFPFIPSSAYSANAAPLVDPTAVTDTAPLAATLPKAAPDTTDTPLIADVEHNITVVKRVMYAPPGEAVPLSALVAERETERVDSVLGLGVGSRRSSGMGLPPQIGVDIEAGGEQDYAHVD